MLLMVRVVDVMVLLMPMVLQVLYRVMPRVRAPWLVMLRVVGRVAGDADGEGAVGDAPGGADAEGVAGDALVDGATGDADGEGSAGDVTVYGVAGDDDGEIAAGGGSGVGPRVGGVWPVFGLGPSLFLVGGLVNGVAGRWACQSCCCL